MRLRRWTIRSLMLVIAVAALVSALIVIVPSWVLLVVSLCLLIGAVPAPLAWFTIRHVSPKGPLSEEGSSDASATQVILSLINLLALYLFYVAAILLLLWLAGMVMSLLYGD